MRRVCFEAQRRFWPVRQCGRGVRERTPAVAEARTFVNVADGRGFRFGDVWWVRAVTAVSASPYLRRCALLAA